MLTLKGFVVVDQKGYIPVCNHVSSPSWCKKKCHKNHFNIESTKKCRK